MERVNGTNDADRMRWTYMLITVRGFRDKFYSCLDISNLWVDSGYFKQCGKVTLLKEAKRIDFWGEINVNKSANFMNNFWIYPKILFYLDFYENHWLISYFQRIRSYFREFDAKKMSNSYWFKKNRHYQRLTGSSLKSHCIICSFIQHILSENLNKLVNKVENWKTKKSFQNASTQHSTNTACALDIIIWRVTG